MIRLRRTVLYVPADNARALYKARTLSADAVILDLEDSVAPDAKATARRAAVEAGAVGRETLLRINAPGTPWHEEDVAAARNAAAAGIVLPKVRGADDVLRLADKTGAVVWPMMETARAILSALAVADAAAGTGPAALLLGTNDLAAELGASVGPRRAEISWALQATVLAGRAARIDVIDAVFNDVRDSDGLAAEAAAARALGMSGKSVIHPGQIAPVNAAFTPDADALADARRVVDAVEAAAREGRAVATLDGRLVEGLHADAARRTIALAEAAAARERA